MLSNITSKLIHTVGHSSIFNSWLSFKMRIKRVKIKISQKTLIVHVILITGLICKKKKLKLFQSWALCRWARFGWGPPRPRLLPEVRSPDDHRRQPAARSFASELFSENLRSRRKRGVGHGGDEGRVQDVVGGGEIQFDSFCGQNYMSLFSQGSMLMKLLKICISKSSRVLDRFHLSIIKLIQNFKTKI